MKKLMTDQAKMVFEIAQWYCNKGFKINEALIKALINVPDENFRKEFINFPYEQLNNYEISNINEEISKFIDNINSEIITLKDIFINIEDRDIILSKLKINYKIETKVQEVEFKELNTLLKFGFDLVQRAENGLIDPIVGRENEITRVIHVLSRKIKNNPLLIGEAGVGKTSVVEAVAQKIAKQEAGFLNSKKIVTLDLNSIVAGTKFRGDLEERMQQIISILVQNPNIILFIDEMHSLVKNNNLQFGDILKPYLSKGEIQVIGSTTNKEYREIFQKEKPLDRRFQSIMIPEPSIAESLFIINNIKSVYENYHNVKLEENITNEIISLAERYMTYRKFPDKAIDILDELCSYHKSDVNKNSEIVNQEAKIGLLRNEMSTKNIEDQYNYYTTIENEKSKLKKMIIDNNKKFMDKKIITIDDLYKSFHKLTGIPVGNIKTKEKEVLLNLESNIRSRIVGQQEAISNIAKSIIRSKLGYTRKNKPIASFLFVGPSGIGKTETSKVLADILFPNQKCYKRFDMSEYIEPHSISKLLGSPPGYIGFGSGGLLTNFVKENPYSIILFDEIEKANETIENLMLQLLDNGTVSDTNEEIVNFNNTIVIFTSNCLKDFNPKINKSLGFIQNSDGKNNEAKDNSLYKKLEEKFKPEFLNRIDYVVLFNELSDENLMSIIDLEINKLSNEYLSLLDISINDEVRKYLLSKLSKKNARYITKAIQNEIIDPLINKSLKNELNLNKKIIVNVLDNKLIFKHGKKKIHST